MARDASSYWVGPAEEPDRFRLTHLLGSGGEGEVWRAVRPGSESTEVAIKINRAPAEGSDEEARLRDLAGLRIKGLVRLHEVFAGAARHRLDDEPGDELTHQYVVMDYVEGITLRTWLDEHPDAPARHRVRILRGLAGALTSLHRGPDGTAAITHGDVKPANVIIRSDGKPVLVDFGLLRTEGSGPASGRTAAYSSPELRNPDAVPSPRADTFSFAVTAMETLTALTPPLDIDGNLDLAGTRQRIATAPALRVRPLLRRQLLRSLTEEPQRRPGTPVRVFAGRAVVLTLVPVLSLTGAAGAAIALQDDPTVTPTSTPTSPESSSTVAPPGDPSPSVSPTTKGPQPTPTGTPSPVSGNLIDVTFSGGTVLEARDPEPPACAPHISNVVAPQTRTGRAWGDMDFTFTLTARQNIEILKVTRVERQVDPPPTLLQTFSIICPEPGPVVSPPTECRETPPKVPYRLDTEYLADLDNNVLREKTPGGKPFGIFNGPCLPPTQLYLDARNCSKNVDYSLKLRYRVASQPKVIYEQIFQPLQLLGRASGTSFVTSLRFMGTSHATNFAGGPEGCASRGVTKTRPWTDATREIALLVVQAVGDRRRASNLTFDVAVERTARRLQNPRYTAAKVRALCVKAVTEGWRANCGKVPPAPAPEPDQSSN